ncbi:MAG: hypothetical protein R2867_19970 [Caldilineaceae bacterium]
MDAAIDYLDTETNVETVDAGEIAIGDEVTDEIAAKSRVHYTIEVKEGDVINLHLGDEAGELDTILSILDTAGNSSWPTMMQKMVIVNSAITDLEIPVDLTP